MRAHLSSTAIAGIVYAVLTVGAVPGSAAAPPVQETQNIVVHLGHFTDNLHATFMALKVANALQKQRAKVTLFLDLEGARLAHQHNDLNIRWGESDTTLGALFDQLVKGGGKVIVCPHCARHASVTESTARERVVIASEDQVAEAILKADKVIDY